MNIFEAGISLINKLNKPVGMMLTGMFLITFASFTMKRVVKVHAIIIDWRGMLSRGISYTRVPLKYTFMLVTTVLIVLAS